MKPGKDNPNYKHGKHCEPQICACGRKKDYRSKRCAVCAKKSSSKEGDSIVDLSELKKTVKVVSSLEELARKLGTSRHLVTRRVKEHNIDISHFRAARGRTKDPNEYLKKGSKRRNHTIRTLVLREGLLEYECHECGLLPYWNGKELVLELDHIDGDPTNNEIENLRFLCPNCHSQTPTSKGKNSKGTRKGNKKEV